MQTPENSPSPTLVEEYRRQLLAMQRHAAPSPREENWLDSRFPEPNIERDKAAVAPTDNDVPAPPITESPFVGYLRVFAYTADEAEPLANARVVVSRDGTLYANAATDRDGYTPVIALPTVDPALTLQPGTTRPYVAYDIQVNRDGFRGALHENVPIYGNNYVTQPVVLLPLLPNADPDAVQDFVSGGPANL